MQKSLVGALAKPTRNVGGGHFKGGPLRKKDEERDEEVETLRRQLQEKRVQVGSLTKRADGLQSAAECQLDSKLGVHFSERLMVISRQIFFEGLTSREKGSESWEGMGGASRPLLGLRTLHRPRRGRR